MSRHSQLEDDRAAQPHYASGWGLPQGAVASDRPGSPALMSEGRPSTTGGGRSKEDRLFGRRVGRQNGPERGKRAGMCIGGKIELVGGDFALYIEGHIHLKPILRRFGVPNPCGVLAQPRNT